MATLLLAAAGSAAGGAIGGSFLGVSSALIGQAVGAKIGSAVDAALFGGSSSTRVSGPRLDSLDVMTSREGAPVPVVYGRAAVAGEVIWSTSLRETATDTTQRVGSGKSASSVTRTDYSYSASLAVAVGAGPVAHFGRVWLDGRPFDVSKSEVRFYHGTEDQAPDRLIEEVEGAAPAYRGIAYLVFEDLQLADFGNRVPQVKVEIFGRSGDFEKMVRGVDLIPGSTEFGYAPDVITKTDFSSNGEIISERPENAHRWSERSDWSLSMDMLDDVLPNCDTVALVVSWFGTDLRAGRCQIIPKVEDQTKKTAPRSWRVAGLSRADAQRVTDKGGRPAFGSAPDDESVIRAIEDLRARGKRVVLYPFVMMDIAADAGLPNPSGTGTQGAYPWRGRIMPDAALDAASEVAAFVGPAVAGDFSRTGDGAREVVYSGADWGFARFVLHLANLAAAAGGVEAFLIGSEMRGMTQASAAPGSYPFVDALRRIAGDVRAILPAAKISYAADWSEYHSHRSGSDVWFNLDPLWADANIDFIAIDNYLPLSDWRSGRDHKDFDEARGHTSIYSLDYLKSNIEGGEYWDYYYASESDRLGQIRTPITEDHHGETWVWRQKAIRDWCLRPHHNRPGGVRSNTPTAFVPGVKRVWFSEVGCPAVDRGSNQPNVFYAAGSVEAALPFFSDGVRDDFISRQYTRAVIEWWAENGAGVIDPANILVWSWDARPWPEFPQAGAVWSDGPDWTLGHWLGGRVGGAPVAEVIRDRLVTAYGLSVDGIDVSGAYGQVDGYPVAGAVDFRSFMHPLEVSLALDVSDQGGKIVVTSRHAASSVALLGEDDLIEGDDAWALTRSAEVDLPRRALLRYRDTARDYQSAATLAERQLGTDLGVAEVDLPLILDLDTASAAAEGILRRATEGRERARFRVSRAMHDLRPGGLVSLSFGGADARQFLIERVLDGSEMEVEASLFSEHALEGSGGVFRPAFGLPSLAYSAALGRILDLPLLPGDDEWRPRFVAHGDPWPGGVDLFRADDAAGEYRINTTAARRTSIGETVGALPAAMPWVWSGDALIVRLFSGNLVGRDDLSVLAGENMIAVQHGGGWEVVQFRSADLVAASTWRLSGLLRGQYGTEALARTSLPSGASVALLGSALAPLSMTQDDLGQERFFRYAARGLDPDEATTQGINFAGIGLRPYAPAHLRAVWQSGALAVSWVRRCRSGGDAWAEDDAAIPLGEAFERYRVDVLRAGAVVRSIDVDSPGWVYSAGEIAADSAGAGDQIRVAQISDAVGVGWPSVITIN